MRKNKEAAAAKAAAAGPSAAVPAVSSPPPAAHTPAPSTSSYSAPSAASSSGGGGSISSGDTKALEDRSVYISMPLEFTVALTRCVTVYGFEYRIAVLESKIDKFMRHFGVPP